MSTFRLSFSAAHLFPEAPVFPPLSSPLARLFLLLVFVLHGSADGGGKRREKGVPPRFLRGSSPLAPILGKRETAGSDMCQTTVDPCELVENRGTIRVTNGSCAGFMAISEGERDHPSQGIAEIRFTSAAASRLLIGGIARKRLGQRGVMWRVIFAMLAFKSATKAILFGLIR